MSLAFYLLKYDMSGQAEGHYAPFMENSKLSQNARTHYQDWLEPMMRGDIKADWDALSKDMQAYHARVAEGVMPTRVNNAGQLLGMMDAYSERLAMHVKSHPQDQAAGQVLLQRLHEIEQQLRPLTHGQKLDVTIAQSRRNAQLHWRIKRLIGEEPEPTLQSRSAAIERFAKRVEFINTYDFDPAQLGGLIGMYAFERPPEAHEGQSDSAQPKEHFIQELLGNGPQAFQRFERVANYCMVMDKFIASTMAQALIEDHFAQQKPTAAQAPLIAKQCEKALAPVLEDQAKARADILAFLGRTPGHGSAHEAEEMVREMQGRIRATAKGMGLKGQDKLR